MYQFYCWLICSHLQQVMDCLDAWLISSIDQSIENTKPSSKADMENMSDGRSLSRAETSLTLLAGLPSYTIKTELIETKWENVYCQYPAQCRAPHKQTEWVARGDWVDPLLWLSAISYHQRGDKTQNTEMITAQCPVPTWITICLHVSNFPIKLLLHLMCQCASVASLTNLCEFNFVGLFWCFVLGQERMFQ